MKFNQKRLFKITSILIGLFMPFYFSYAIYYGTIDPNNNGDFYAKLLDDGGFGAGQINFGKFTTESSRNITIYDDGFRGYMWGETFGWAVMSCQDTSSGCSSSNGNFKVDVDSTGLLSGYAWGETAGWINFGPFTNASISRVKISASGDFAGSLGSAGYAWSQNFGWIIFDCSASESCVRTNYIPSSYRQSSGGGGGGVSMLFSPFQGFFVPSTTTTTQIITAPEGKQTPPPTETTLPSDQGAVDTPQELVETIPQNNSNPTEGIPADSPLFIDNSDNFVDTNETDPMSGTGDITWPTDLPPKADMGEEGGGAFFSKRLPPVEENYVDLLSLIGFAGIIGFLASNRERLWQALTWPFGFFRRKKKWGIVYDSITKRPLDPAYVIIKGEDGKMITNNITDLDGRYGFIMQPGIYYLEAQKTNYKFPSEKLAGLPFDEVYNDLYFGGPVEIKESGEVVSKNIPMDPVGTDWNEIQKKQMNLGAFSKTIILRRLIGFAFYAGLLITLISFLFTFSIWHLVLLCLYGLMFLRNTVPGRMGGRVKYRNTKKPVGYAIVKIYAIHEGFEEKDPIRRVTSKYGEYFALVPSGHYRLTVEVKNDDGTYMHVYSSGKFKAKKGLINKRIYI